MNRVSFFSYPYDTHLKDPPVVHVHKYVSGFFSLWHAVILVENIKEYDTCL